MATRKYVATDSLWQKVLEERTFKSQSNWETTGEEPLPVELRKVLSSATIVLSKNGEYKVCKLEFTDKSTAIFAVDWSIQDTLQLGDQLRVSTLILVTKVNKDTGAISYSIRGRKK